MHPRDELLLLFITAVPNTKLCAWGEEDSGGHVLIGMMITLNLRNCPPGVNFFWGSGVRRSRFVRVFEVSFHKYTFLNSTRGNQTHVLSHILTNSECSNWRSLPSLPSFSTLLADQAEDVPAGAVMGGNRVAHWNHVSLGRLLLPGPALPSASESAIGNVLQRTPEN